MEAKPKSCYKCGQEGHIVSCMIITFVVLTHVLNTSPAIALMRILEEEEEEEDIPAEVQDTRAGAEVEAEVEANATAVERLAISRVTAPNLGVTAEATVVVVVVVVGGARRLGKS